jgi:hypothetical protein
MNTSGPEKKPLADRQPDAHFVIFHFRKGNPELHLRLQQVISIFHYMSGKRLSDGFNAIGDTEMAQLKYTNLGDE